MCGSANGVLETVQAEPGGNLDGLLVTVANKPRTRESSADIKKRCLRHPRA